MSVYLLFDNHDNYDFLAKHFENVIYSPKKNTLLKSWIAGVIDVLKQSKENDTIICWYDFQAVILFWIASLIHKKRKIICLNILLKNKKSIKNKIVTFLYKKALSSDNFRATVTSEEYGVWLNKKIKKKIDYTILHDVYHNNDYVENNHVDTNNAKSVFCGGRNGRDWNFLFEIVSKMPDVVFNIVLPKNIYEEKKHSFPPNANVKTEIPLSDFLQLLNQSKIACLPLDTIAPAGLIVMFQAAAYDKLIVTTDTVTTQEYLKDNRGVILPNNTNIWINEIDKHLNNDSLSKEKANRFKEFLKESCSEEVFVKTVQELIK